MKRRLAPAVAFLLLTGNWAAGAGPGTASTRVVVSTLAEVDAGSGGLSIDAAGNVYTADFGAVLGDPTTAGTKVFKISPDGAASIFAEGFEGASGNGFDSKGILFQSNIRGGFVSRVTPAGKVSTFASDGFQAPVGIDIDGSDTLFVANCGSGSIQKVTADGKSERFVESELLKCPNGITLGDAGNLYVANFYNGDVIKITPAGEAGKLATIPGNNNGHLAYANGSLYVVGRSAHQVFQVSLSGEVSLLAGSGDKGGADGPAAEASFCYPNDIIAGADGNVLYVNDVANHESMGRILGPTRVRRIALK